MFGSSDHSTNVQESEEDENEHYKYGVSAMQGWRTEMVGCCACLLTFHRSTIICKFCMAGGSLQLPLFEHDNPSGWLTCRRTLTAQCWTWTPHQARASSACLTGMAAKRSRNMLRSTWQVPL